MQCKVDGCERLVTPKSAKGMCPKHYTRWVKHGDTSTVKVGGKKKVIAPCTVEGCEKLILQKGYCRAHYMKWYRHGDANFQIRKRGRTPTVVSWTCMKQRCSNPKSPDYYRYGGRGITFDERWKEYKNFLADMGERPEDMTLDRIDVNGNYTKENCRWADPKTQSNNTRANIYISYSGQNKTATEWSMITGLSRGTISYRIHAGWSAKDTLTKPSRKKSTDQKSIAFNTCLCYIKNSSTKGQRKTSKR